MAIDMSMPVLVVDDYNTMIRIIRNLLKQLGFEDVDDASDGSAARIVTAPASSITPRACSRERWPMPRVRARGEFR